LDGFDILAVDVARAVPPRSKVCELYGGVGVLGLTALAHHYANGTPLAWLRCSDENPANARCFYRAVESLPQDMTGYITERQQQRNAQREYHARTKAKTSPDTKDGATGLTLGHQQRLRPPPKPAILWHRRARRFDPGRHWAPKFSL
jgi:hypothetical protein